MNRRRIDNDEEARIRKIKVDFRDSLDVYLREKPGRTLTAVAKSLGMTEKGQGRISRWRSDKYETDYPDYYYQHKIRDLFGNQSLFRYDAKDDYAFNTDFINQYIKEKYFTGGNAVPEDAFDQLHSFVIFLKSIKYDEHFPLWTPIVTTVKQSDPYTELDCLFDKGIRTLEGDEKKDLQHTKKLYDSMSDDEKKEHFSEMMTEVRQFINVFDRAPYSDLPNAAPSDCYPEFQVDKGKDGIKVLQMADIAFINLVLAKVIDYIYQLFDEHDKELHSQAQNASNALRQEFEINGIRDLTDEERRLADPDYRWYIYSQRHNNQEGDDE